MAQLGTPESHIREPDLIHSYLLLSVQIPANFLKNFVHIFNIYKFGNMMSLLLPSPPSHSYAYLSFSSLFLFHSYFFYRDYFPVNFIFTM